MIFFFFILYDKTLELFSLYPLFYLFVHINFHHKTIVQIPSLQVPVPSFEVLYIFVYWFSHCMRLNLVIIRLMQEAGRQIREDEAIERLRPQRRRWWVTGQNHLLVQYKCITFCSHNNWQLYTKLFTPTRFTTTSFTFLNLQLLMKRHKVWNMIK